MFFIFYFCLLTQVVACVLAEAHLAVLAHRDESKVLLRHGVKVLDLVRQQVHELLQAVLRGVHIDRHGIANRLQVTGVGEVDLVSAREDRVGDGAAIHNASLGEGGLDVGGHVALHVLAHHQVVLEHDVVERLDPLAGPGRRDPDLLGLGVQHAGLHHGLELALRGPVPLAATVEAVALLHVVSEGAIAGPVAGLLALEAASRSHHLELVLRIGIVAADHIMGYRYYPQSIFRKFAIEI